MSLVNWIRTLFIKSQKTQPVVTSPPQKSTEEKGIEFEKFIMKRFHKNKRFFAIKAVTADKGFDIDVRVDANLDPDLIVEFRRRDAKKLFAVECKWRKNTFHNYVNWASNRGQIERYKKFAKKRDIPVFIALGLGGEPHNPKNLYVIPLEDIQHDIKNINGKQQGMIYLKKLNDPERGYLKNKHQGFFYDLRTGKLN